MLTTLSSFQESRIYIKRQPDGSERPNQPIDTTPQRPAARGSLSALADHSDR
jgi:hypothetical protein